MKHIANLVLCGVLLVSGAMAQKQPKIKSAKELEAIKAMLGAQAPDDQIAKAEALVTTFADTEWRATALAMEADAYARKGDFAKAVIFGESALAADPNAYQPMLLLARQYAGHTGENDLDKEEKLGKATKYANDAIAAIAKAEKPNPSIADAQWEGIKKDYTSQAHESLGMVAEVRKKLDVAAGEYKTAIDGTPTPDGATVARYASVQARLGKFDEAIAAFDKLIADPNTNPQVKAYAEGQRKNIVAAKSAAKK